VLILKKSDVLSSHLDEREMLGQCLDSVGCKDSHSLLMQLLPVVRETDSIYNGKK
jgi:hypothetical protein